MNIILLQRQQQGLSLIELMIAITLSLVLTLGVIQIFSSSKQTNRVQTSLGGVQENARFALDILSYDLRMAGNIGCNSQVAVNNTAAANNLPAIGNGITGFERAQLATASPLLNTQAIPSSGDVVAGTDVVVVRYAAANARAVTNATVTDINLANTISVKNGDPLIISDCQSADLFVARAGISTGTGNNNLADINAISLLSGGPLSKIYGQGAEVAQLRYVAYYIRTDPEGFNNLYRSEVNGVTGALGIMNAEPLLQGVEDMQLLYGERLNNSNIRYVPADTVGINMNNITSVRLNLLLSTLDNNLTSGSQQYWQNGEVQTVTNSNNTGKKLLRGFTTTVQLRN